MDLPGKKVAILLRSFEELKALGVPGKFIFAMAVDRDTDGLWVENPEWAGAPEGPDKKAQSRMHFLIPWPNIASVCVFPNEKGFMSPMRIREV